MILYSLRFHFRFMLQLCNELDISKCGFKLMMTSSNHLPCPWWNLSWRASSLYAELVQLIPRTKKDVALNERMNASYAFSHLLLGKLIEFTLCCESQYSSREVHIFFTQRVDSTTAFHSQSYFYQQKWEKSIILSSLTFHLTPCPGKLFLKVAGPFGKLFEGQKSRRISFIRKPSLDCPQRILLIRWFLSQGYT